MKCRIATEKPVTKPALKDRNYLISSKLWMKNQAALLG
jgi:hypothetical protein